MATHASAIKRHRQSLKRRERNIMIRSSMKTQIKKLLTAISEKDKEKAGVELQNTIRSISKASSRKILHWKTAARKISRLTKQYNQLGG